jgi:hypothetical protein
MARREIRRFWNFGVDRRLFKTRFGSRMADKMADSSGFKNTRKYKILLAIRKNE